jgi:hypothetical protein
MGTPAGVISNGAAFSATSGTFGTFGTLTVVGRVLMVCSATSGSLALSGRGTFGKTGVMATSGASWGGDPVGTSAKGAVAVPARAASMGSAASLNDE